MYFKGVGGTGKSRVIKAIYNVFGILNYKRQLILTTSLGNIVVKI